MTVNRFRRAFGTGDIVFREGEAGDCAYVVESGRFQVYRTNGDGERVLAEVEAGALLGEMALIDNRPRTASVRALQQSELSLVTRDYFMQRIDGADPMLRHILRLAIDRYRELTDMITGGDGGASDAPLPILTGQDQTLALERLRLQQDAELALERGEFELHSQPIVHLGDGSPAGFEALIRWKKDGRYVPPMDFIPQIEESDLIVRVGQWTLETACLQLAELQQAAGGRPLFMGVNLSARQFTDPDLFRVVEGALARSGVPPHCLKLEITETLLIENFEQAVEVLGRCKAMGLKLALDDFGTGYSSLSYLNRFPVDMLKIDRAFVKEMLSSRSTHKIVRAIAGLGRDLAMDVLAEGVETGAETEVLRQLGVDYAQGWYFAKALKQADALAYVRKAA